jgi:MraZ protein
MGTTFQIWEPAAAERRRAEARVRARDLAPPRAAAP